MLIKFIRRQKNIINICLLLIFSSGHLFYNAPVLASDRNNKEIKIGSYLIPGIVTAEGTGMFNQLNKAILTEIGEAGQLILSSAPRARNGIKKGELDAYFPELWENLPGEKSQYVVSNPIFYKRIILFTLKGSNLTKLSDIDDELIGVVKGFAYGEEITANPQLNLIYQDNDITNIRLLLNQRLSGVLGGYPGTVLAVKKHDATENITYDLNKPVAVLESFYVCKNTTDGIKLCDAINKAISTLITRGELELNTTTGFSRFTPS